MENTKLIQSPQQKTNLLTKVTAALLGVSSLIGWSAILNSFDYFSNKYPKEKYHDVTFLFSIPLQFASFVWGLGMDYLSKKYSIKIRIAGCLAVQSIFMISMPITAILLQNWTGFIIQMCLCFFIGTTTCIAQNSSIAMLSQFDSASQGIYWIFTSWSGLSMNFGRAAVLGIFGDNDSGINNGTIVYFLIAAIIMFATIFCFFRFLKSDLSACIESIKTSQDISNLDQNNQASNNLNNDTVSEYSQINDVMKQDQDQEEFKIRFLRYLKKIKFLAIFIFLSYVITFMLFPGVSIYQKQYTFIDSFAWATLLMQFCQNIGDLSGKALSNFHFYNAGFMYILTICRCIFFFTFLMTARNRGNSFFSNDYFGLINMLIFGFTNGLVTGGLMQLGPQRGNNSDEKNLISLILAFGLTFGISIGAFLALTLEQS